jgi:hypothetical protein
MNNGKKKGKLSKTFSNAFLKKAHKMSIDNGASKPADEFGCFHCRCTFKKKDVKEFADREKTILCPNCGIDSAINFSELNLEQILLDEMYKTFFNIDGKE